MRVLVDTSILRRPATGTARWVRGLTGALAAEPGVEVLTSLGPARLGSGQTGRASPGIGGWLLRIPNVARQRWWYEAGLRRLADREQADALLMPANMAARRGRRPQVVAILDVNFLTQPATYEPASARYLTWSFRRAMDHADRVITISSFSRSEICRHLGADPDQIAVVYPGLDPPMPTASPLAPLDRPYALWVGATEVSKNLGLLLDAWAVGAPEGLCLVLVGPPGRDHPTLVRRAAALRADVIVCGPVTDEELERWYAHASVFLFPSRTEGFGFPPLEAMARGVPVIAARAGSLPEVLGEAALYHDPDDAEAVRAHLTSLVQDHRLRNEMVERGRDRAGRYPWSATGSQVAGILRGAIGARG